VGGNRHREGGIPRIGLEHGIMLATRKGTAPSTTATSAITSTATARATTAATMTREGDGHCYLLDSSRSVLPPLSSPPKTLLVEISTKSPNLQPKNIFAPLEGIFAHLVQKSLPEVPKFELFSNL
jgi:hypothetical protein